MRNALLLLVAVAVLYGGALLLAPRPTSAPAPRGADSAPAARGPEPAPAPAREVPAAGAVLVGRVTSGGAPVAAELDVRRTTEGIGPPPAPILSVATAADGRFEIPVPAPGRYVLLARSADGATGRAAADVPVAGLRVEVRVRVAPPGSLVLAGRARHADGTPFAGILALGDESIDLAGTDGSFRFEGLLPGEASIHAWPPGRGTVLSRKVGLPHPDPLDLVVDENVDPIRGRVLHLPERSPVAGARIETHGRTDAGDYVSGAATTDAEGRFEVDAFAVRTTIEVAAIGYPPAVRSVPAGTREVEVLLVPGGSIAGRVRNEDGAPAAGAVVRLRSGVYLARAYRVEAKTDSVGAFVLADAPCGESALLVDGDEDARTLVFLAPGESLSVDLRRRAPARVSGRVVDAAGAGVAGALVTATHERREVVASTDADGAFEIAGLFPGEEVNFVATAPGHADGRAGPLLPVADAPTTVEIRLPATRSVEVRVLDAETGVPVAGAWAFAHRKGPHGDWGGGEGGGKTGPDGVAVLDRVPVGRLGVTVSHPDHVDVADPVPLAGGADGDARVLVRLAPGLTIAGRVLGPDGSLVPRAWIHDAYRGSLHVVAENGTFLARGVAPGGYLVEAHAYVGGRLLSGETRAEAGTKDVTIRLADKAGVDEPGRLFVRLLDPAGEPVLFARVECVESSGGGWVRVLPPGEVHLDEYARRSGPVTLVVSRARSRDGTVLGSAVVGPLDPDEVPVSVRLAVARAVTGIVRDAEGRPVPGVHLRAELAGVGVDVYGLPHVVEETRADDEGRFAFCELGPAEHRIVVEAAGAPPPVAVLPDTTTVDIRLRATTRARLLVLAPEGRPVPGAVAECVPCRAVADESGVAELVGLDPAGGEALSVRPPPDRRDLGREYVRDWEPADGTIRLPGRGEVAGFVRDEDGRGIAGAKVVAKPAVRGHRREVRTRSDGSFRIPDLPSGRVALSVSFGVADPEETGLDGVEVTVGDEDVLLLIRRLLPLAVEVRGLGAARATVMLHREGRERSFGGWERVAAGRVDFQGLVPDVFYTLSVKEEGLVAFARVRGDAGAVTLDAGPPRSITGRLVLPPGSELVAGQLRVRVDHPAFRAIGRVEPDFTYEVPGLPPGEWKVVATGPGLSGSVEARAGGSADIELR